MRSFNLIDNTLGLRAAGLAAILSLVAVMSSDAQTKYVSQPHGTTVKVTELPLPTIGDGRHDHWRLCGI